MQVNKSRRTHMLHEQLNAIKKELGLQKDDKDALLEKFRARIKDVKLAPEVKVAPSLNCILLGDLTSRMSLTKK